MIKLFSITTTFIFLFIGCQSQLDKEAIEQGRKSLSSVAFLCKDRFFYYNDSGVSGWYEATNIELIPISLKLTDADKLNKVEWSGTVLYVPNKNSAQRPYLKDLKKFGDWGPVYSHSTSLSAYGFILNADMAKINGEWSLGKPASVPKDTLSCSDIPN